jgi:hypothetical protein
MNKRRKMLKKFKSIQNYTWIYFLAMMFLANYNGYFGLLGFISMLTPIVLSGMGYGRLFCSHICDRGSFLGKVKYLNLGRYSLPMKYQSRPFRFLYLFIMLGHFSINLFLAENLYQVGYAVFKLFLSSTMLGILLGIIFKPRTWCQICPMGFMQSEINNMITKKK